MVLDREVHKHLTRGDFDALEEVWLGRLEAAPDDVSFFVDTARATAGQGQEGRASTWLELADDALRERALYGPRLALLEGAGHLFFAADKLHAAILATLSRLFGDRPHFNGLVEKVGLHRATHDLPKTWEKVARLRELIQYEVGSVVWMEGRGGGRVVDVNFALESFKVDFDRHSGLQVGFRAAAKLLKPLPPGHVLRRKVEDPAGLAAEARRDPPEVLRLVLEAAGRPLTAGEIREHLVGIVDEAAWASWWAAARKDPRLIAGKSGRQTYSWAESHGHASESRWTGFAAASPREQIARLRRDATRDPEMAARMIDALTARFAAADPGLEYEIACALERVAPGSVPAPAELLAGPEAPARLDALLAGIDDRALRERAYGEIRGGRDDWRTVFRDRLGREDDPRALDALSGALAEAGDPELERFLDGLLVQPHRAPAAFVWLAERAAEDAALRQRSPLRLLQQILAAGARHELTPFRARLHKLAQSGGTLPRLLDHLSPDQAAAAREAFDRAAGLEAHEREALIAALELRFPGLREDRGEHVLYALPDSIATKRAELERLRLHDIPANRKAIEEARAMGDLRENFEYKSARQRHEYLSALVAGLVRDLAHTRPLDLAQVDPSEVRVGTRVRLVTDDGKPWTLTVLGPWESDPDRDVVSYQSELAQALLGRRPGETADASGQRLRIVAIDRIEPDG